jgi:hypothetical protein
MLFSNDLGGVWPVGLLRPRRPILELPMVVTSWWRGNHSEGNQPSLQAPDPSRLASWDHGQISGANVPHLPTGQELPGTVQDGQNQIGARTVRRKLLAWLQIDQQRTQLRPLQEGAGGPFHRIAFGKCAGCSDHNPRRVTLRHQLPLQLA